MNTRGVVSLVSRVRRAANGFIEKELAAAGLGSLQPAHGSLLVILFQSDGMCMKELAAKSGRDKSTLTPLVNRLVALGFARREADAHDARTQRVFLTQKGQNLRPGMEHISSALLKKAYSGFTEMQKRELIEGLQTVLGNLTEDNP